MGKDLHSDTSWAESLELGTPGRQPTYLPQVVVQPDVLRMLAKALFPALRGGTPTHPATEITGGVGENNQTKKMGPLTFKRERMNCSKQKTNNTYFSVS